MSQSACSSQYFQSLSQIGHGQTSLPVDDIGGGILQIKADKPFFPVLGLLNTGAFDTIINESAFYNVFENLMSACYTASVNKVGGITSYPKIETGAFDQYLYKMMFGNLGNYNTYFNQAALVREFLRNMNAGMTAQQYQEAIGNLMLLIKNTFRQNLFVPPGTYQFDATVQFYTDWNNWKVTTPGLDSILCLEIYSI